MKKKCPSEINVRLIFKYLKYHSLIILVSDEHFKVEPYPIHGSFLKFEYCRTHNVSVCLYIAYIACGSASLYIKTLYFFLTVLALAAAATVANIEIRYDAKTPQFALLGTRVIYVFYSI